MTKQPHLYHINNSTWNFIFFQYIFVRKNIFDIYWHCIELQISRALWLRIFIEMLACCRYWMPPRCQTPARGTDVSVRTLRGRSSSVYKRNVFAKRGNSSHQRKKHAIITSCKHCKMDLLELRNNGWVFLTWDMCAFKSFKHCHIYNSVIVLYCNVWIIKYFLIKMYMYVPLFMMKTCVGGKILQISYCLIFRWRYELRRWTREVTSLGGCLWTTITCRWLWWRRDWPRFTSRPSAATTTNSCRSLRKTPRGTA